MDLDVTKQFRTTVKISAPYLASVLDIALMATTIVYCGHRRNPVLRVGLVIVGMLLNRPRT